MLTLQDRCGAYKQAFPQYPDSWPWVQTGRWLNAMWLLGNNYKGSGYYGAYPPEYLDRVAGIFPDVPQQHWVHLYSGSLDAAVPGLRIDIRRQEGRVKPSLVGDARALPLQAASVRLIAADPPYSEPDADKYEAPPQETKDGPLVGMNKRKVMVECARVVQVGGFLVWLDTTLPVYNSALWTHFGMIGVQRSTNHAFRLCSLFERTVAPWDTLAPSTVRKRARKAKSYEPPDNIDPDCGGMP